MRGCQNGEGLEPGDRASALNSPGASGRPFLSISLLTHEVTGLG